jgi:hypothetical protein
LQVFGLLSFQIGLPLFHAANIEKLLLPAKRREWLPELKKNKVLLAKNLIGIE